MVGLGHRERDRFEEWAAEHLIPLDPDDDAGDDIERLAPLDEIVDGKRIVFVGESNHFVHEKYRYRLLLIRYLFFRGWRTVGEELGWSDGIRVDRYLASGDRTWLDRVSAYGYRGDARRDRDDTPTGLLREGWDTYPEAAFRFEQVRFAETLRSLTVDREGPDRLRLFGFDVDYHPETGYLHLGEWLDRSGASPVADELRSAFARVPGETLEGEAERLGVAVRFLESNEPRVESCLGTDGYRELLRSAATLRDSHRYASEAYRAKDYDAIRPAMARRERLLCEHVDHVLDRLGPEGKVVLFAHDLHLARDDSRIRPVTDGVGPGGGQVPSVGAHVARRFPGEVASIWMLDGGGEDSNPFPSIGNMVSVPPTSLNAILARLGDVFVLPLRTSDPRARLLATDVEITTMYGYTVRAALAEQADAVYFQRRVTPLRAGA